MAYPEVLIGNTLAPRQAHVLRWRIGFRTRPAAASQVCSSPGRALAVRRFKADVRTQLATKPKVVVVRIGLIHRQSSLMLTVAASQ